MLPLDVVVLAREAANVPTQLLTDDLARIKAYPRTALQLSPTPCPLHRYEWLEEPILVSFGNARAEVSHYHRQQRCVTLSILLLFRAKQRLAADFHIDVAVRGVVTARI